MGKILKNDTMILVMAEFCLNRPDLANFFFTGLITANFLLQVWSWLIFVFPIVSDH